MTERDLLDWRGIGMGYVILICIAGGVGMAVLAPPRWGNWLQKEVAALILVALYLLWLVLKRPLRWAAEGWAGKDRGRHEGMKNLAVILMCAISAAFCVAAFPLALRYSWPAS
ncbi:hypothetical protein [Roseomonas indoligenes]|uniref:Uncharacterized protein n=1 Tax=Roseomonas indoligenes TaxID=2820811 RepID=A0A940MT27_9PROT|nr:hypothetical protein [Pararoseomonas indoligenes]MBP0492904.1 hypothetical protein [Pararoseomonas indoligenes]